MGTTSPERCHVCSKRGDDDQKHSNIYPAGVFHARDSHGQHNTIPNLFGHATLGIDDAAGARYSMEHGGVDGDGLALLRAPAQPDTISAPTHRTRHAPDHEHVDAGLSRDALPLVSLTHTGRGDRVLLRSGWRGRSPPTGAGRDRAAQYFRL